MSSKNKTHVHQVTPYHKSKSGFFAEDSDDLPDAARPPQHQSLRDLMGGIHEEEKEMDEENMYAHELPPDPLMQKHTIEEVIVDPQWLIYHRCCMV